MPQNDALPLNALQRVPTEPSSEPEDGKQQTPESGAFWAKVKWLAERGMWKGDYREYNSPPVSLNKGDHYFVLQDAKRGTIKCISCAIRHGGILEAHLLTRYALKDGVLYFDNKPTNSTPPGFVPGD